MGFIDPTIHCYENFSRRRSVEELNAASKESKEWFEHLKSELHAFYIIPNSDAPIEVLSELQNIDEFFDSASEEFDQIQHHIQNDTVTDTDCIRLEDVAHQSGEYQRNLPCDWHNDYRFHPKWQIHGEYWFENLEQIYSYTQDRVGEFAEYDSLSKRLRFFIKKKDNSMGGITINQNGNNVVTNNGVIGNCNTTVGNNNTINPDVYSKISESLEEILNSEKIDHEEELKTAIQKAKVESDNESPNAKGKLKKALEIAKTLVGPLKDTVSGILIPLIGLFN
ncbi:hypothetical protein [Bifidobacterium sp. ESL0764]|uniref:hypothetical protein n=1 Tax=Bifidobacterium sp. ESL0764 TaxID=2983228 RepID=UPI0023F70CF5|nr:hypothetical protein [Bifidobacterium sp. ESL0764]WEV66406.1 hypothetical protein OZX71_03430 [Bifidobacterium sp. ESL0764]